MSFIESYKRLDNLCKDIFASEKGVTTYLENMEIIRHRPFAPLGLEDDYKKLKHYRYVRNKIVHDNYATELNMCDAKDVIWIQEFHQRIMDRTDPISLYRKHIAEYANLRRKTEAQNKIKENIIPVTKPNDKNRKYLGCALFIIPIVFIAAAIFLISAFLYHFA